MPPARPLPSQSHDNERATTTALKGANGSRRVDEDDTRLLLIPEHRVDEQRLLKKSRKAP